MKKIIIASLVCISGLMQAQSTFNEDYYRNYLQASKQNSVLSILAKYQSQNTYVSEDQELAFSADKASYFGLAKERFELTEGEIALLNKNHFVVTDRLQYKHMCDAFDRVYERDLPVFITSDAILQALHQSYDNILREMEIAEMEPNLRKFISSLRSSFNSLSDRYGSLPEMKDYLADVNLCISVAESLIEGRHFINSELSSELKDKATQILDAIYAENYLEISLYTYSSRKIDFSQFKPRGHYEQILYSDITLEPYFRTTKWFSFIEFIITKPVQDPNYTEEDIKRMRIDAFLMNELITNGANTYLFRNNELIEYLVGESDNLTPEELESVKRFANISSADELLSDETYASVTDILKSDDAYSQKILSSIISSNPINPEKAELPVIYKVFGDRFIVDSYIFQNVVYDQIINNNEKVMRMMPNPLDAMFVLGNDNALPLLQDELQEYQYGYALDGLRYLVDSYDEDYWTSSMYNTWLKSLKELNMPRNAENMPFFTKTVAWQHEKLNTQLASWAQLRHDNLLYTKQSYTRSTLCEYPHGYVEPYPSFFKTLQTYAENSSVFFSPNGNYPAESVSIFWSNFAGKMDTLAIIAEKEVAGTAFGDWEKNFFERLLFKKEVMGCNIEERKEVYSGWYPDLYYDREKATEPDYIVADVHTQPTDEVGNKVGKVLHVGVGKINMGLFIAPAPSDSLKPTIYAGPVFSYYEKVTNNFTRLADSDWKELVKDNELPDRPDWVNVYLADNEGKALPKGRTLQGIVNTIDVYGCLTGNCFDDKMEHDTLEITLKEGWNLITVNHKIAISTMSELFPHATTIKTDNVFSSSTQSHFLNKLDTIKPRVGYLIKNSKDETITIETQGVALSKTFVLKKGWNLVAGPVGIYPVTNLPGEVLEIKNAESSYLTESGEGDLTNCLPTKSHFIKVSDDCELTW